MFPSAGRKVKWYFAISTYNTDSGLRACKTRNYDKAVDILLKAEGL